VYEQLVGVPLVAEPSALSVRTLKAVLWQRGVLANDLFEKVRVGTRSPIDLGVVAERLGASHSMEWSGDGRRHGERSSTISSRRRAGRQSTARPTRTL